eukprot:scaffold47_cov258-Pinguiococcus_pyrenoidosus.AAC.118
MASNEAPRILTAEAMSCFVHVTATSLAPHTLTVRRGQMAHRKCSTNFTMRANQRNTTSSSHAPMQDILKGLAPLQHLTGMAQDTRFERTLTPR